MRQTEGGKKSNKKRLLALLCGILIFAASVLAALEIGVLYTARSWERWYADYEKQEISALLEEEALDEEDYALLYRQTGLTPLAIDDMRGSEEGRQKILSVQRAFFAQPKVKSKRFAPFTYIEELVGARTAFCALHDGDIIVTANTRVSWWRYGHACIVVDAKRGLIAEAIAPGCVSEVTNVSECDRLADFLVLRPKASKEIKAQVVQYILDEGLNIPYRFSVGIFSAKAPQSLRATQCAHFVWYAYNKFGVDLDSNGGGLVKPQDIALSNEVELVQSFGFDLEKLWSK